MSVSESFARIELWLSKNAPNVLRQLNKPGTSAADLEKAESVLGAKFPPSVREAYTHYNGESSESTGLFGSWRWLPLREVIEWDDEQKQNLTTTNSDLRYVETSGDDGQEETPVIEWNHQQPTRDIKYGSFANYLSTFAERLELGEYKPEGTDPSTARGLVLKQ